MGRRLTIDEAAERFARAAYSTRAADRDRTERAVATLYAAAGLETPTVVWAESPQGACLAADEAAGPLPCRTLPGDRRKPVSRRRKVHDEITHIILPGLTPKPEGGRRWDLAPPCGDAYPASMWQVIGFGHGIHDHPSRIATFVDWDQATAAQHWAAVRLVENVGWWRFHREGAFLSERPERFALDRLDRPHSAAGPAVVFRDGWELYAIDGIRLPGWAVERPELIPTADIDKIRNAELRRVVASLVGDRYIEDRGELWHADEWGELWLVGDLDGFFLRVTDATVRPDGTRRRYWLRVPDEVTTALEAVAWTFGLTPETYAPVVQT